MLSSPTCPARVSFAGCVLPSGPFPCLRLVIVTQACGWLSQPLSTMPDKTPQEHIAALRRPTWIVTIHARNTSGLPEFYDASLLARHGLMTPADLHILAKTDASVLPSAHVKTLGVRNCHFEAVPALRGARPPLRPA